MTPEARAARERKQKIFVVVGGLFLVALLAFQVPKLLGGSSTPEAAATTTSATAPVAVPAGSTSPVALPAAATTPVSGKITAFGAFDAKDPFVQQVVTEVTGTGAGAAGATTKGSGGSDKAKSPAQKFSTGSSTAAAVTIVTVNGTRQVLEAGMKFPSSDPVFVLVAEKPSTKSVVIGIAGGAYSGGARTTTLKAGKPLTLVNTATGAKYKIALVSVGSGEQAVTPAPKP